VFEVFSKMFGKTNVSYKITTYDLLGFSQ